MKHFQLTYFVGNRHLLFAFHRKPSTCWISEQLTHEQFFHPPSSHLSAFRWQWRFHLFAWYIQSFVARLWCESSVLHYVSNVQPYLSPANGFEKAFVIRKVIAANKLHYPMIAPVFAVVQIHFRTFKVPLLARSASVSDAWFEYKLEIHMLSLHQWTILNWLPTCS